MQEMWVWSLGWEDSLEEEMATHSSILASKIPWTEEPSGLQSKGSQRVRHDRADTQDTGRWASEVVLVVKNPPANAEDIGDAGLILGSGQSPGEGHGNPLQYSCLENPMDRGFLQATVHRVAKNQTQLVWLSMHARPFIILIIIPLLQWGSKCRGSYGRKGIQTHSFSWKNNLNFFLIKCVS